MIERQPYLPRFMAGGDGNRSARARSISASALPHPRHQPAVDHRRARVVGCIRMLNADVIDLYARVKSAPRWSCCPKAAAASPPWRVRRATIY
jgi:hypothetical protein